jgi:hypothetical protein
MKIHQLDKRAYKSADKGIIIDASNAVDWDTSRADDVTLSKLIHT